MGWGVWNVTGVGGGASVPSEVDSQLQPMWYPVRMAAQGSQRSQKPQRSPNIYLKSFDFQKLTHFKNTVPRKDFGEVQSVQWVTSDR